MTIEDYYNNIKSSGNVSRQQAEEINELMDFSLEDDLPMGSFTAMSSEVNMDGIMTAMNQYAHISTIMNRSMVRFGEIEGIIKSLENIFPGLNITDESENADLFRCEKESGEFPTMAKCAELDKGYTGTDLKDLNIRTMFNILNRKKVGGELGVEIDVIDTILTKSPIPRLFLKLNVSDLTLNNIIKYFNNGGVEEYKKHYNNMLASDNGDTVELNAQEFFLNEMAEMPVTQLILNFLPTFLNEG